MAFSDAYPYIAVAADAAGVRRSAMLVTAKFESGFNPDALNTDGEYSVGLFQLNIAGGAGAGYTEAQLKDPALNSQVAAGYMKRLLDRWSSYEEAIARWCGLRCSNADQRIADWPNWWSYDNGDNGGLSSASNAGVLMLLLFAAFVILRD